MTNNTLQIQRTDPPDDQIYTFEDIPRYAYVIYLGMEGYVVGKGPDLMDGTTGRHLAISLHPENEVRYIHENVVNKKLRQKRDLFVDFEESISPISHEIEQNNADNQTHVPLS